MPRNGDTKKCGDFIGSDDCPTDRCRFICEFTSCEPWDFVCRISAQDICAQYESQEDCPALEKCAWDAASGACVTECSTYANSSLCIAETPRCFYKDDVCTSVTACLSNEIEKTAPDATLDRICEPRDTSTTSGTLVAASEDSRMTPSLVVILVISVPAVVLSGIFVIVRVMRAGGAYAPVVVRYA